MQPRPSDRLGAVARLGASLPASQRWSKLDFLGASDTYLCDSCKYNDARYCSQPDRPNAKRCPDYKIAG